jgi:excinuclease UvrABC nuclease subunit
MNPSFFSVFEGGKFNKRFSEFKNLSGVYIIKGKVLGTILYIGESHTGNLEKTVKRHFWTWNDDFLHHHFTYEPILCEVMITNTTAASAKEKQDELILKYKPRDNPKIKTEKEETVF